MQQRVAYHTLGCKLNFTETSAIGRQFREAGFSSVSFDAEAEVYVINTCSVTEQANKKCRQVVRQALRANPAGFVVVVGCYAQLKPREIAEIPGVDMVLGANDKFRILELAEGFQKQEHACIFNDSIKTVDEFVPAFSVGDRTRSFLKIQDGCDYKCAFCTIPLARGKSRSDSLENILANARRLSDTGVKEIVLTGVNIGDYGKDQPHNFLEVIQALDDAPGTGGIARFRISSIEPNLCSDEVIRFVAASKRFAPHFHMPLQSGSNDMLRLMRRRYRRELYVDRVALIRDLIPDAAIGVDVIVGHPGESEERFLETYRFLNELAVSYFHVFTYSERENTVAWDMADVVEKGERGRRNKMLRILSEKKRRAFYDQHRGEIRPVIFERQNQEDNMLGFTDNYIRVVMPFDADLVNRVVQVKLGEVRDGLVEGLRELVVR